MPVCQRVSRFLPNVRQRFWNAENQDTGWSLPTVSPGWLRRSLSQPEVSAIQIRDLRETVTVLPVIWDTQSCLPFLPLPPSFRADIRSQVSKAESPAFLMNLLRTLTIRFLSVSPEKPLCQNWARNFAEFISKTSESVCLSRAAMPVTNSVTWILPMAGLKAR